MATITEKKLNLADIQVVNTMKSIVITYLEEFHLVLSK